MKQAEKAKVANLINAIEVAQMMIAGAEQQRDSEGMSLWHKQLMRTTIELGRDHGIYLCNYDRYIAWAHQEGEIAA